MADGRLTKAAVPMLAVAALVSATAGVPAAGALGIVPPANPGANVAPSEGFLAACAAQTDATPSCQNAALGEIDADRAAEGVVPMALPTDFDALSPPQQDFVVTNLERVDRGLPPVEAMADPLDGLAQAGALAHTDPSFPPYGSPSGSTVAGTSSALLADALWLYDDGPGATSSPNVDCPTAGAPGCWGHRDIILGSYPSPLVMGAGQVAGPGGAVTQLFVGGDTVDPPAFSWDQVVPYLQPVVSTQVVQASAPPGGQSTVPVSVSASGAGMTVGFRVWGSAAFTLGSPTCTIAAGHSCSPQLEFRPPALGTYVATLAVTKGDATSAVSIRGVATLGYRMVAADGGVFAYGLPFYGSTGATHLNQPIVGMATDPVTHGYWLVARDGGVFGFHAPFEGSLGSTRLNQPVVGMAPTPDGLGYWLVAADGGVFPFGDARYYGSTGNVALNRPVVGMAVAPGGRGYWLTAADGGVFPFGAARWFGSTGSVRLNQPIVGMAADPATGGYWLVASDGGIFDFHAPFLGSAGGVPLNRPVLGMAPTADGGGYWLVASDGGVFDFGDAGFFGSMGSAHLNQPMTGLASTAG